MDLTGPTPTQLEGLADHVYAVRYWLYAAWVEWCYGGIRTDLGPCD